MQSARCNLCGFVVVVLVVVVNDDDGDGGGGDGDGDGDGDDGGDGDGDGNEGGDDDDDDDDDGREPAWPGSGLGTRRAQSGLQLAPGTHDVALEWCSGKMHRDSGEEFHTFQRYVFLRPSLAKAKRT